MNRSQAMLLIVLIALFGVFLISDIVAAQPTLVPERCRNDSLDCQVEDLIRLIVNIGKWVLALVGSISLIYFIYGGFLWVTAAGRSGQVEKGRDILIGTTIGIVIVLGAFVFIDFIGDALGADSRRNEYLQGTGGGTATCASAPDGTRCAPPGLQNVYVCLSGICDSTVTLCEYLNDPAQIPNSEGVTANHSCKHPNNCVDPSSIVSNLCNGDSSGPGALLCCN